MSAAKRSTAPTDVQTEAARHSPSQEVQFAQAQKMQAIGQLAGGMAHDFNNLITGILGFCDLLQESLQESFQESQSLSPEAVSEHVAQIRQNAQRGAALVRDLLAFSRKQTLSPSVLCLEEVIESLHPLLERLLGAGIRLHREHAPDLWHVKVDRNQFEQVVVNLVVNARDAMPGGGTVRIRTANVPAESPELEKYTLMPPAEYVLCEVADSGPGIPQEHVGKIFEPFFSTKTQGTGLGLSTVYGIVKQTGGFIFPVAGDGAVFHIYLPRTTSAPEPIREVPVQETQEQQEGVVLLVEDDLAIRRFATRALEARGYRVLAAADAREALRWSRRHKGAIHVVVSDVVMPEKSGPVLVKELRRTRPDLRVIFISGYAEDAFRDTLDQTPNFRFLPKPFGLGQLTEAVREEIANITN